MASGVVVRMQNVRRYIIFDTQQIRFNLILDGRHTALNMHNLWGRLEFYYRNLLYFRTFYVIINLFPPQLETSNGIDNSICLTNIRSDGVRGDVHGSRKQ